MPLAFLALFVFLRGLGGIPLWGFLGRGHLSLGRLRLGRLRDDLFRRNLGRRGLLHYRFLGGGLVGRFGRRLRGLFGRGLGRRRRRSGGRLFGGFGLGVGGAAAVGGGLGGLDVLVGLGLLDHRRQRAVLGRGLLAAARDDHVRN